MLAIGNWDLEIPTIIIKANSPLNCGVELPKKRKLVKMRGILKKKVVKRNSSNSYTVRRKCLTVNTAAVHIPIKVSNKVRGS